MATALEREDSITTRVGDKLSARVAFVTGGTRGIGAAICRSLASQGATLAAGYAGNDAAAEKFRGEFSGVYRTPVSIHKGNVGEPEDCRRTIGEVIAAHGRLDILVNNAGWTGTTPALEVTEDEFDKTMAASVKSVFFACQAAARVMIPQGRGKIINIGSNFGVVAFSGRAVYAGAKAAVHHLSRALSLEWAKSGVHVNVVAPCITETDSRKVILERPGYKEWATTQMLPAGRWNHPEDLVGAVLFLSSHLSDMVVGHVLMVDGGWTIH